MTLTMTTKYANVPSAIPTILAGENFELISALGQWRFRFVYLSLEKTEQCIEAESRDTHNVQLEWAYIKEDGFVIPINTV